MLLNKKTLERLRELINEETEYRSGPKLVDFFNSLGFQDSYGQGFPSRWLYTDDKLSKINGTPELDKCIKTLFNPINFVGRFSELDEFIKKFNQYLLFDKWKVVRNGTEITFKKVDKVELKDDSSEAPSDEDQFLEREFKDISIDSIGLNSQVADVLKRRLVEIKQCLSSKSSLSVIFLSGSSLEGILLGVALIHSKKFNQAKSAPKDKNGKVKPFQKWKLSELINTSYEVDVIEEDVKKFSHSLRDFRNYIHPYEQVSSHFNPNEHTAKICFQVLKAAIYQINTNI
ncbi:MAG: hypothetical protein R3B71_02185 [Candidatus Gracilibacteria bacterium]